VSFSSEVKAELARISPERPCCQAAELCAIFRCEGAPDQGAFDGPAERIRVALKSPALARKVYLLLRREGCEASLEIRRGDRRPQVRPYRVDVRAGAADLRERMEAVCGPLGEGGLPKEPCCLRAYLRGAFLCCGSLASPEKGYHLEFAVEDAPVADSLVRAMAAFGLDGKISRRKGVHVVYLKDGEQIVEALKLMGANKAIFEMENVRIVKGMRNRVNRLVNSETANVDKTVNAALSQLDAIRIIEEEIGLDALPKSLGTLARLRLQHPYASLRELGELLTPKVSKSGVSYRMNRLMAFARKLMEKDAGETGRGRRNMITLG